MSSASFQCRFCGREILVTAQRLIGAKAIRCDRCFAINSLSDDDRADLMSKVAPTAPAVIEAMMQRR